MGYWFLHNSKSRCTFKNSTHRYMFRFRKIWMPISMGGNVRHEMGEFSSVGPPPCKLQRHTVCSYYSLWGERYRFSPCGALLYHMKFTIAVLSNMLPGTSLVWSSIIPRIKWRSSSNIRAMELTRKRINRGVRSYLTKIGGYVIKHPDLEDKHPSLFLRDGVHLSFIANDIFLNQVQGALETFLKFPYCLVYPFD